MSERLARLALALSIAALVVAAMTTDLAALSGGRFWGDGATYLTAAKSLAEDGDLRYEARDALRVRREFEQGAQGIFLKRSAGGFALAPDQGFPWLRRVAENEKRIYFAKPFTYPLLAWPLVRLFGTRGLLLTNALALGLALLLAYLELRRQAAPWPALLAAAALLLTTVAPVYLFWPTPEATSLGLVAAGLFAWRRGWPLAGAIVLGIATYSKPPCLFLALPLGLAPLLSPESRWSHRWRATIGRGLFLAATAAACYGMTWMVTGEWNYQGGSERKTFYGVLPLEDHKTTFGNSGIWMSQNQVGPRVEGTDEVAMSQGAEPPRAAADLRESFLRNLYYFWIGRYGGVLPYFLPFAVALFAFLGLGPRERHGVLAVAALVISWLFYIWLIPDNWYGGSGTLGNRYFLTLLPLGVLLVPRGREWLVAGSGALSLVFTFPLLADPVKQSLAQGAHAQLAPFRWLPAELTMLNDLAIFGEAWRKKRAVGDPDGDPKSGRLPDPASFYLYFPDDGSYGREESQGSVGFWVRGGGRAEVFLRALEPVVRMTLSVTGGPSGDELTVQTAGGSGSVSVAAGESRELDLEPGRGVLYKDTFLHVLRLRSQREGVAPDGRRLGAFVSIRLDVAPRPKRR